MDNLLIAKTASTPLIDFKSSGQMCLKGRLLPENPKEFFDPLFNWVDNIKKEEIVIDIKLSYINTSSSKRIIELVRTIDGNGQVKKVDLNWHYETDDSEMLEFGETIQRNLKRTKTQYIECEDIED